MYSPDLDMSINVAYGGLITVTLSQGHCVAPHFIQQSVVHSLHALPDTIDLYSQTCFGIDLDLTVVHIAIVNFFAASLVFI